MWCMCEYKDLGISRARVLSFLDFETARESFLFEDGRFPSISISHATRLYNSKYFTFEGSEIDVSLFL